MVNIITATMIVNKKLLLMMIINLMLTIGEAAVEQCQNFGGSGLDVYPREGRLHPGESSHRLHWSKAQSINRIENEIVFFLKIYLNNKNSFQL